MSEQQELMTAPMKRTAPLRWIVKEKIGNGGPLGGRRLYFLLSCGHVQERMLKAAFNELERVRCVQCIGQPANPNELAMWQWWEEHAYDAGAHYMASMAAAAGVEY